MSDTISVEGNPLENNQPPLSEDVIKELNETTDVKERILILLTHFAGENTDIQGGAEKVAAFLLGEDTHVSVSDILSIADIRRELRSVDHAPQDPESKVIRLLESPADAIRRTSRFGSKTILNDPSKQIGRNNPCPCGSGRKYKKCCGAQKNEKG